MAQLDNRGGYIGTFSNVTAYKRRDSDKTYLRAKSSLTKERIKKDPSFEPTRKNNSEFGGRSTTSRLIREVLEPLKTVVDYNLAPVVAGKVNALQKLDLEGEKGKRSVQLTRNPQLLEGFQLNRKVSFDSVVAASIDCSLNRQELSARLQLPAFKTDENFFPQRGYPYFRLMFAFGMVPDLYCQKDGYLPSPGSRIRNPILWQSPWQPTASGLEEQNLELVLGSPMGDDAFTLLLAVGVSYGKLVGPGIIEPVRYVGGGKILKLM